MNKIIETIKTYFSTKQKTKVIGTLAITMIFLGVILSQIVSFASLEPIKSVEIPSTTIPYITEEDGSWNIIKSVEWISKGKARLTLKLETIEKPKNEYTDVILVLDTSGSMAENKITQVKNDVTELIDNTIPKGNNIALITFNDTSSILSDFTNNQELLKSSIENIEVSGETNYNQALVNVDYVLKDYVKEDNRDCVILFLTDGLPTIETPNEIAQYEYLKTTYPYLVINGIQYEMGDKPLEGITKITDNQYIADTNTLNKFLYRAATSPAKYNKLQITDYVLTEYFSIDENSSIKQTSGTVTTEENNIIWNLDGINSGSEETLTIDINLSDDLIGVGGVYPTNESISVTYEIGNTSTTETSTSTPIISDNYQVIYEENAPTNCTISNMPASQNYSVFDTVKIETEKNPICDGYKFKEWKIITEEVEQTNKDYFIMPEKNVTLRATWTKLSTTKSMEGTVSKTQPLYEMIADNSLGLDDITESTSGIHTITSTQNDTYPVHYYSGAVENNNLLFAEFCWKIVRTTSTGGVKLLYNGEPTEDNQCLSTRESHIGYNTKTRQNLASNYYYGTDYIYDTETSTFSLSGELIQTTWSDTTYSQLLGKYTCMNTEENTTCTTLYQVASYDSSTTANVLPLNSTIDYSLIGTGRYNSSFSSISDGGYMYDDKYYIGYRSESIQNVLNKNSTSATSNYYYGNDAIINEDGTYTLTNAEKKIWSDNYSNLIGYYTCRNESSTTCTTLYYIANSDSSYQYNVELKAGALLDDQKIVISPTKTNNEDGSYTLTEPIEVLKKDWFEKYSTYVDYYLCSNLSSTQCSVMSQVSNTNNYQIKYIENLGLVYGNNVEWNGENYVLNDTYKSIDGWLLDRESIASKYHYTCLSSNDVCTDGKVYYIYYISNSKKIYYITLNNGENIDDIKEKSSTNDENSTSSDIKLQVDSWYLTNMTNYTDMLEDTIWCNDRTISKGGLKSKDSPANVETYFGTHGRIVDNKTPSTICPEPTRDGFTVSTESGGNGLLNYPIGLLTADEVKLANTKNAKNNPSYIKNNYYWWTMSPNILLSCDSCSSGIQIYTSGLNATYTTWDAGVRPSVSLKPGTKSFDGDGSEENPFIVK